MTYRIRMLYRKWVVLVFDQQGNRLDSLISEPFDNHADAQAWADQTGYINGDTGHKRQQWRA